MARWPLDTKSSQSEEYRLASLCRHPPFTLEISSAPRLERAQAQTRTLRRNRENLILNERPRSYLDASNVVPVSSLNFRTSGCGQTVSYLNLPPYSVSAGVLPNPVTKSPIIRARNPFSALGY